MVKVRKSATNTHKQKVDPDTIAGHLEELRRRLIYVALIVVVGLGLGWAFQGQISQALIRPLGESLYYSSPTGGLDFVMTLSICVGALLALPFAIYHSLSFVEPISHKPLTRSGMKIVTISFALAITGGLFAYFVTLPAALNFLKGFDEINVNPLLSAKEYLTFAMTYIFTFAIIFQLPLIMGSINRIKPLKPEKLIKKQRWVILASFIIAAFATPTPDPMNQAVMALPLIVLFNVSILIVWIQNSLRNKPKQQTAKPAPAVIPTPPVQTPVTPPAQPHVIGPPLILPAAKAPLDLRSTTQTDNAFSLSASHNKHLIRDIAFARPSASQA